MTAPMTNPTPPEGWTTGVKEHGVRCCSTPVLNAAEWAVRAYPALVALQNELDEISRDHAWHPSYRNAAALAHNKIASILALAKEEKE